MQIETGLLIAIVGIVAGWFSKGYAVGKKEQKIQDSLDNLKVKVNENAEKISNVKTELKTEIKELKGHHEKDFDKIMNIFYDDATKSQRFLTVPGHADFCKKNTETLLLPISNLNNTVEKLSGCVERLSKGLADAEQAIAIIESMKKGGARFYDPPKTEQENK